MGLGAEGIAGLAPPTAGFAPGAGGLGLDATGGGGFGANELAGRELAGEASELEGVFFHGAADPLAGPIPGKTETGLADASADVDTAATLGAGAFRGGGGGAAGVAA